MIHTPFRMIHTPLQKPTLLDQKGCYKTIQQSTNNWSIPPLQKPSDVLSAWKKRPKKRSNSGDTTAYFLLNYTTIYQTLIHTPLQKPTLHPSRSELNLPRVLWTSIYSVTSCTVTMQRVVMYCVIKIIIEFIYFKRSLISR